MNSRRRLQIILVMTVLILLCLAGGQTWLSLRTVRTKQAETLQCGQWCLMRTAHVLGFPLSAEKAIEVLPYNWDGHSMLDIKNALHKFGFDAKPVKNSLFQILNGPLPALLHLKEPDHYVVAVSTSNDRVLIFDAQGMRQRIRTSSVEERFSGYALVVSRDAKKPFPPDRKSAAQIQFATLYRDQGDVPQGFGSVGFEFPLTNTGTEPLVIAGLHSDCSCMEVKGPDIIPPGGSGIVTASFRKDPEAKRPFFMHTIAVESNDSDFPVIPLVAAGNTGTTVVVSPFPIEIRATRDKCYLFVKYGGDDASLFHSVTATSDIPGISTRVISVEEYQKTLNHFPTSGWSPGNDLQKVVEITYSGDGQQSTKQTGSIIIHTSVPGFEEKRVPCTIAPIPGTLNTNASK